jgi:[NiFe] hydrogenase diaphorase moiety small subunit
MKTSDSEVSAQADAREARVKTGRPAAADDADNVFLLDGEEIPFAPGQTVIQAATAAGKYVPHLCWHPEFKPYGSCKLCTVKLAGAQGGRLVSACTTAARPGMEIENRTPELDGKRRTLIQMLFVEGNHFCPSCEKSGDCLLQATAYELEMQTPHFDMFYPDRPMDASHPGMVLDFNRCIMCALCETASREVDKKNVFAMGGRGIAGRRIHINSESGLLADTDFAVTDRAASICPVGVFLPKGRGFAVPMGSRTYDKAPVSAQVKGEAK